MNHFGRSDKQRKLAWDYLREELTADLALVQEAVPPAGLEAVYRPVHPTHASYKWGSAVVALGGGLKLLARKRVPLESAHMKAVAADELPDSHPGACAVADVLDAAGNLQLTAISLYGQWEMRPGSDNAMEATPRLHRMLSDLTGVFVKRGVPIVVAGDWNISTQGSKSADNEAAAVFARLRAWRMADAIAHTRRGRPKLEGCMCSDDDACPHVRTYRHNNRADSSPTQFDYAFVSERLLPKLECHVVHDEAAWALSDHAPILIDVRLG